MFAEFPRLNWLAMVCLVGICGTVAAQESAKPNVILVVIDDMGWADLSCYGSSYHKTPKIDRLAKEGLRFTNGYAACPVCSPTRAALMTGRYPARLHLTDWLPGRGDRPLDPLCRPKFRQELPLSEVTIAELLQQAGYATASIGKWHLGGEGFGPTTQGFGLNIGGNHIGTPLSYFAPYQQKTKDGTPTFMPNLETAPAGEYLTDRLHAEAVKFIRDKKNQPFFLYLPHYTVHTPMKAKPETVEKYAGIKRNPGQQGNPVYAAMIESLDDGIGLLLETLDELKLTEKTIVIFTSDNGGLATNEGMPAPPTNNSPLREGKGYLYEGGIRVPWLVKWPGVAAAGSTSNVPICSIDVFPTLVEACGLKAPDSVTIDGVSFVPALKGASTLDRPTLYWHYPHYANQGSKPGAAIRHGDFKLIEFYEDGRKELFNLQSNPGETSNLVSKHPEVVADLSQRLDTWRKSVDAQMMTPNPDYHPNPQDKTGVVTLPASRARVHGINLRYEPLAHKNTLGFWTRPEDWAEFEFEIDRPGEFEVVVLQGCGKGSGDSVVELAVGDQAVSFTVEDTGHFQNFIERGIGKLVIDKPGRHSLTVKPKSKPGAAVMDLRQVQLKLIPKP